MPVKVSVYLTCHNYGRFVAEAIDSVYDQLFDDWELLIINDGSSDDSKEVIDAKAQERPDRVRIFHNTEPEGLANCANLAIDQAQGQYIIRLDADDYFDESALLTMATFLDRNPNVALVYPNYQYVDEDGNFLGVEQRKRVGTESKVLDLPAHGACTMARKRVLKSVGGYSTDYRAQDGHQIWLKILNRYQVANVSTSLFYYRQHSVSMTRDMDRVLQARRAIKRDLANREGGDVRIKSLGIIPAKNTYREINDVCLQKIAGKALIDYTLDAAFESGALDWVLVASDDQRVLDHCAERHANVLGYLRPIELSHSHVRLAEVVTDAVEHMEKAHQHFPDAMAVLNVHTPLRTHADINEAIDTLQLYNVDSVTSVYEDLDLHFHHGEYGLEPLNYGALDQIQLEREALYVDNNAIKVIWRDVLSQKNLFGQRFGHIVMPIERSLTLYGESNRWMIEESLIRMGELGPT